MHGTSNERRRPSAKGLSVTAAYLILLAAVTLLATGTTYGLLSATSPVQADSFAAGTVTLAGGTSGSCAVSSLLPTSPPATCTLGATYTGDSPAYLAVDVLIQTQAGAGGTPLYDPSGSGGLQVTISSANPTVASYAVPVAATACPSGAPAASTCYALLDELVSTAPFTSASPPVDFTTTISLPPSSPSGYQDGAAQIILQVHTAQAGNNWPVGGCTAGQPCAAVNWN